jgi:hypothetical protein
MNWKGCWRNQSWPILAFSWRGWQKLRKPSVKTVGILAKIPTGHFLNISQNHCHFSQLAWLTSFYDTITIKLTGMKHFCSKYCQIIQFINENRACSNILWNVSIWSFQLLLHCSTSTNSLICGLCSSPIFLHFFYILKEQFLQY